MSDNEPSPHVIPPDGWDEAPKDMIDAVLANPEADIIIDASQVKSITTQVAQLLLSLQAFAEEHGTVFRLDDVSETASASLRILGLDNQLLELQT